MATQFHVDVNVIICCSLMICKFRSAGTSNRRCRTNADMSWKTWTQQPVSSSQTLGFHRQIYHIRHICHTWQMLRCLSLAHEFPDLSWVESLFFPLWGVECEGSGNGLPPLKPQTVMTAFYKETTFLPITVQSICSSIQRLLRKHLTCVSFFDASLCSQAEWLHCDAHSTGNQRRHGPASPPGWFSSSGSIPPRPCWALLLVYINAAYVESKNYS